MGPALYSGQLKRFVRGNQNDDRGAIKSEDNEGADNRAETLDGADVVPLGDIKLIEVPKGIVVHVAGDRFSSGNAGTHAVAKQIEICRDKKADRHSHNTG